MGCQQRVAVATPSSPGLVATISNCMEYAVVSMDVQRFTSASGATASTYLVPTGLGVGTHAFSVDVTCGGCTVGSNAIQVIVSQSPSVTITPSGSTQLCTGYSTAPILTSSISNCSGPATYQWYLNNSPIIGATSSSYAVPSGLAAGLYNYVLSVTCANGCTGYSNIVSVIVHQSPSVAVTITGFTQLCTGYTATTTLL